MLGNKNFPAWEPGGHSALLTKDPGVQTSSLVTKQFLMQPLSTLTFLDDGKSQHQDSESNTW